ncbi:MAG: conjugal transfer protein TraR [Candidatus Dadabacteria bacterium]|nr:MAG: conjugal transfer protein TraR [Candidatus Dadabacteria bacterium]
MKKKDLEKFRKILLEEKKKILQHLQELSESSEEELQFGSGDDADLASLEISQANLTKIGTREARLLKKIDYSLKKIEEGTYGICENCGEEINVKRLEARPVATLCIDCKNEQETQEKKLSAGREKEEEGSFIELEKE